MATKARLDVLFAKSRMNGAYACPIGSGKSRFAPSSPDSISQFETSSNNSRIVRPIRSWPQTRFWEIAPDKRATGVCQAGCKGTGGER